MRVYGGINVDITKVDKSYLALLNIYGFISIRTNLFPKYESFIFFLTTDLNIEYFHFSAHSDP